MRHEYSIWGKEPEWAWNVISSMLLARNPDSFRAYFRGYQSANRYWDAPDGLRYWRGRFEIDRGQPDDAGLRRVAAGAKAAKDWEGPGCARRYRPVRAGRERRVVADRGRAGSGFQPCRACELTNRKAAIVATPRSLPRRRIHRDRRGAVGPSEVVP